MKNIFILPLYTIDYFCVVTLNIKALVILCDLDFGFPHHTPQLSPHSQILPSTHIEVMPQGPTVNQHIV